jgi:hypothetical protein
MSFVSSSEGVSVKNLDQLDQTFMYSQIPKEILLKMDFDESHVKLLTDHCREQFTDNCSQLNDVHKLESEYVDVIVKLGFFVRDLHQHINQLHIDQFGDRNLTQFFNCIPWTRLV